MVINNSDPGVLLKFVENQYLESTLDGNLHFSLSGKFIDQEKEQSEKGIGDSREGAWSRPLKENSILIIGEPGGKKYPLNVKSATFHHTFQGMRMFPIMCFTYLSLERDFIKNGDNFTLKDEVLSSLLNQFEGRSVIVFDPLSFFTLLDRSLIEQGYEFKRNLIEYYDERKEDHPLDFNQYKENPFEGLFYKRNFFEFQKEYRIAIADFKEEDLKVSIKDIRNCTQVLSTEELKGLKILKIEDRSS